MPHPGADYEQGGERQPRVRMPVGDRKVVADHREHDRQRQVIVVHGALLAAEGRRGIRLPTRLLRVDQLPVGGDDHEEDVAGHHRPEHRADLDVLGSAREEVADAPGRQRHQHEQYGRERDVARDQSAEAVVDEPRCDEQRHADRDRLPRPQVGDRFVDQIRVRVHVVEDDQESEAREPGRVGLPLEPVQRLGQRPWHQPVLLHLVEAAAVDLPRFAADPALGVGLLRRRA